jgi:hypothetical protein
MRIAQIINQLIDEDGVSASQLIAQVIEGSLREASVHRPARGKLYIAYYTGSEPGRQVSRSTKLADYDQAMALASKWEREARAQRAAHGAEK